MSAVVPGVDVDSAGAAGSNTVNDFEPSPDCGRMRGPRGCPGPRGPAGPQPPLSDAVDSDDATVAASSKAVRTLADSVRTRAPATGLTLYVEAGGNDGHDGLSVATAKATIRGALDALADFDCKSRGAVIRLGEGEFASPGILHGALALTTAARVPALTLCGAGMDATGITGNLTVYTCSLLAVQDLAHKGTLYAADNAAVWVSRVRFIGRGAIGFQVYRGASLVFQDTCDFAGDFSQVWVAVNGGTVTCGNLPITCSLPVTCQYFVKASHGALIVCSARFPDADKVAGARWHTRAGGSLVHPGTDPDAYFPGTAPGDAATGQYTNALVRQVAELLARTAGRSVE